MIENRTNDSVVTAYDDDDDDLDFVDFVGTGKMNRDKLTIAMTVVK